MVGGDFQSQMITVGEFEDDSAGFGEPIQQTRSTTMVGVKDNNPLESGATKEFDVNNITISKLQEEVGDVDVQSFEDDEQELTIQTKRSEDSVALEMSIISNFSMYLKPTEFGSRAFQRRESFKNPNAPPGRRKIKDFTAEFELVRKLGEGGFGVVHEAIHKPTKEVCAIKVMNKQKIRVKEQERQSDLM